MQFYNYTSAVSQLNFKLSVMINNFYYIGCFLMHLTLRLNIRNSRDKNLQLQKKIFYIDAWGPYRLFNFCLILKNEKNKYLRKYCKLFTNIFTLEQLKSFSFCYHIRYNIKLSY